MNQVLPIRPEPHDDESATGFLTRSFSMNRMRAIPAYRWLGLQWTTQLCPRDLPALAFATGVGPDWLESRVPIEVTTERWQWTWRGRRWRGHQTVKAPGQRLCSACVHQNGIAKLVWDLGFFAACPRHQMALVESCGHCGRRLRWHRPSVDVCSCKRHFPRGQAIEISSLTLSWLQWVSDSLIDEKVATPLPPDLLPLFPGQPSIDGMWRLINGFGIRRDMSDGIHDGSPTRPNRLDEILHTTQRGLARLQRLVQGERIGDELHVSALRWQSLWGIEQADRTLALHMLQKSGMSFIPGVKIKYSTTQMELFL